MWIVYRKGSFWLKERIVSEVAFARRKEFLEQDGANFIHLVQESNPWLQHAFELPAGMMNRSSPHRPPESRRAVR